MTTEIDLSWGDRIVHQLVAELRAHRLKPIRIGSRVWIGANCFVKAGVVLGDDAVVAANSNVIEDVPPKGQVIGSPARPYFQVLREMKQAQAPAHQRTP